MKIKIKISIILITIIAGVFSYLYFTKPDPNVYDSFIIVQISDSEIKKFELDIKKFEDVKDEVYQYLNKAKYNNLKNNKYPSLYGIGKKPSNSLIPSKPEDKKTGKYIIVKTEKGFSMFHENDKNNMIYEDLPLQEIVSTCCGGIWNTMNIKIIHE